MVKQNKKDKKIPMKNESGEGAPKVIKNKVVNIGQLSSWIGKICE